MNTIQQSRIAITLALMVSATSSYGNADKQGFVLPPVDKILSKKSSIENQFIIHVNKVKISGNTVFTDNELAEITKNYENKDISSEELETLRQKITRHYVDNGYINSGAIIPDQKVKNGIVNISIVEGKLSDIRVMGNSNLERDYIYQRLALNADEPLNVNQIQQKIQLMLESPLIDKVNAQLVPGVNPGEADLLATVKEGKRYEAGVGVDNRVSPAVGEVRANAYASALSLTGYSDALSANMGYAKGLTNYAVNYNFPVLNSGVRFEAFYNFADAEIVEQPIQQNVRISSHTWTSGFKFILASNKSVNQKLDFSVGVDRRYSKTSLDDIGVPYTLGVEPDGESHITAIRIAENILLRNRKQALALRMSLGIGINALGATENDNLPSSDFFTLVGQSQFAQQLFSRNDQLVVRLDGQLASTGLLPMEQFGVGGRLSVRGYRENQLLRDNGFAGSIEYRITTPIAIDKFKLQRLQTVFFIDSGGAWYDEITRNNRGFVRLTSLGLGFRWSPVKKLDTEFYWAHALDQVEIYSDDSIQDQGIHFSLKYSI